MTKLPKEALTILKELENNHFEAFLVGGFVRDLLLERKTHDIDCATNALPEQIESVFKQYKQSHVGKEHGTIGVKINDFWIEITTYRVDHETNDHRRPKTVVFTPSLHEDVNRRDFTMNALAINANLDIIDYVNGQEDIKAKLIRCVGNPEIRFYEDSLRILRAIRFACQLNFEIDEASLEAMHKHAYLLNALAVERIYQEFKLILEAKHIFNYLNKTKDIINVFLPEMIELNHDDFEKMDKLDTFIKRFGLFFIDKSEEAIRNRCVALKMPKKLMKDCIDFHACFNHEYTVQTIDLKRMMQSFSNEVIIEAMEMQKIVRPNRYSKESHQLLLKLIKDNVVIAVKDLAIDGHDLMELGLEGKAIQETLNRCLEAVMLNKVNNTKAALIEWVNLT
jgi:tRNA nucleotidyltransferase (CCA-adding enzyme)